MSCDADCTVKFSKHAVTNYRPTGTPIITGWCETDGPRLWRMFLIPNTEEVPPLSSSLDTHKTSIQAFNAYDLPCVEALVRYFCVAAGLPVQDTWLKLIKSGNFASWTGLICHNSAKSCPISDETLKVYMVQLRQGIRSTNPNPQRKKCKLPEATILPSNTTPSHELHIKV